jgi:hypothetical protein
VTLYLHSCVGVGVSHKLAQYLRVASLRALEQSPQEHLAFMHASLSVTRVMKHVCVSSQAVIATRALLGDDAPATATMNDLARRLTEVRLPLSRALCVLIPTTSLLALLRSFPTGGKVGGADERIGAA